MSVVRQDTFTRSNQTGWGTASDGNTWTVKAGAGTISIASNEGQLTASTASYFVTLGASLSGGDAEGLVRFALSGTTNTAGILLRYTDTNNYYICRYNGAGQLQFYKKVAGTVTQTNVLAWTPTANTFYWLRFRVQGTAMSIKEWQDGTTEPTSWTWTGTDSSLAGTGGSANLIGLYGFANTTSTNKYDSLSVDNLAAQAIGLTLLTSNSGTDQLSPIYKPQSVSPASGASSVQLTLPGAFNVIVPSSNAASTRLSPKAPLTATVPSSSAGSVHVTVGGTAGTGLGPITASTGTQTWNTTGNGYGTGDATGTEYDYSYVDSTGSGWGRGLIPSYTIGPISLYEINANVPATLPQRTDGTVSGSQTTLLTTRHGSIIHWGDTNASGGLFTASEDQTSLTGGNFTELAPAGTDFRRWLKQIGDTVSNAVSNGLQWTVQTCLYPGNPGFMVLRLDMTNPSGSTINLSEQEIQIIASLLPDTGANPTGKWDASNGFYGTVGGTATNGWGTINTLTTGQPDYFGIVPNASSGLSVGVLGVPVTDVAADLGWTGVQWEAQENGTGSTPGRLKVGLYSSPGTGTPYAVAAGATKTLVIVQALVRNLSQSVGALIAADIKHPGTPTATTGTYTSFARDERAYQFAAASNALTATLDMTGTGVTARYKPIVKITGWTDSAAPSVSWGGSALTAGTDYRYVYDATNTTLYLQLYFDVVGSGALSGQRNNAALAVLPGVVSIAATMPASGSARAQLSPRVPAAMTAASSGGASVHLTLTQITSLAVTVASSNSARVTAPTLQLALSVRALSTARAQVFVGRAGKGVPVVSTSSAFTAPSGSHSSAIHTS